MDHPLVEKCCVVIFVTDSQRGLSCHFQKDAHTCKTCSGEFVDKHRLDAHVKSVHLKVKDIQCTSCGKLFATNERMKIHEKFVHIVEAEKVPCNICLKSFQNRRVATSFHINNRR